MVAAGAATALGVLADGFEVVPIVGQIIVVAKQILAVAEAKASADDELMDCLKAVDRIVASLQRCVMYGEWKALLCFNPLNPPLPFHLLARRLKTRTLDSALRDRLTDVYENLDALESRIRKYDNASAMSKIFSGAKNKKKVRPCGVTCLTLSHVPSPIP